MSTYTCNDTTWLKEFQYAIAEIPIDKLVIGLMTCPMDKDQLDLRFHALKHAGVRSIAIWKSPVPPSWVPYLKDFIVAAA